MTGFAPETTDLDTGTEGGSQRDTGLAKLRSQLTYWAQALQSLPPRLSLPYDYPRPPVAGTAAGRTLRTLDPGTHAALLRAARMYGTTPRMVVLAAINVLLHRYSGETDIAVGVPLLIPGDVAESAGLGGFVNLVVARTDLAGDPDFAEVLQRTIRSVNLAVANQEVPFGEVVNHIQPPRNGSRTSIVDVACSYRRAADAAAVPSFGVEAGSARHDLAFGFVEAENGLSFDVTYRADLFIAGTVERIAGHVETLLGSVCSAAALDGAAVGELEILTPAERDLVLGNWSCGDDLDLPDSTVIEVIGENARLFPDRIAISSGQSQLTFGELGERVDALAARLIAAGVGEQLVGISVERGIDQVVALLAVLRSGGSFVPIDGAWPPKRRRAIVEIAGLRVLIADDHAAADLSDLPGVVLVHPAAEENECGEAPRAEFPAPDPESIACVVFTSGSTGEPKGVMIPHRALSFRMRWHAGLLGLTKGDAVLYKAPLSVDISLNEMLLPLVAGCRLVVAEPGRDTDAQYLLEMIRGEGVTFCYLVASVLDLLLTQPGFAAAMRDVRHLWCGGEPMTTALHRRFREQCAAVLYNGYGPAEATVGVTHRAYRSGEAFPGISIGRPNPNSRVYVLDSIGNPLPIGVIGEIHIGGVQLARGYLDQPLATADRFIPNPFSPEVSSRLYRTGDLARFTSSGELEFVGRADTQVKVRGFRIEVGEIEAVLSRHPELRQAVVLAPADADGHRELHCCAVPLAETQPDPEAIKEWLRERLPDYLIPSTIQLMDTLPLSSSGKVDRGVLVAEIAATD